MAELKRGCTLKNGKYKVVKTLGQGSFGITYLATTRVLMDGQLGKLDVDVNVTIKEFFMCDYSSRAVDGISVERTNSSLVKNYQNKFQREAINLSKLHHPNIVKVLEVFDENNTTYYVMEFIDGVTVDDYIKKEGKLSAEESLKITKEVCFALAYMHRHNMLHLDLKPKNIMRNNEGHIFLIDFGLAKQYKENGEPESSTTIGLGTLGYAPIEQANYKSDGTLPATLDVYALGASLYKMLTGKTPPESSLVLNDGLPLAVLQQANVEDKVIAIVAKAMSPIKKDRYQTVNALSEAISAVLLSDDESTFVQNHEEDTINGKESICEDVEQHDSAHKNRVVDENESSYNEKKEPVILKKRMLLLIVLGVLLVILPVCWRVYNNYSSKVRAEEEVSMYKKALASKDALVVQKYLTEFVDASDAHKAKAKQRYEKLKMVDYIDKHMMNIPMGTAPNYGIYYRYVSGDDWVYYKVGSGEGGTVAAYQLFQYEVTNKIWKTIMGDYPAEDNNKPVNVSYEDCLVFIKKLNELSDKKYRLPTIAEWLLAAKPDSGNKISKLGWFRESGHSLHDVGLKAPNSYGLYDMLGNVHEWCQERFNINNSETQVSSSINGHFAAECGGHFDAHVNSFSYFSGAEIDAVGNCNSVTGFRIARDIN